VEVRAAPELLLVHLPRAHADCRRGLCRRRRSCSGVGRSGPRAALLGCGLARGFWTLQLPLDRGAWRLKKKMYGTVAH
jgi:hypothetical protein